MTEFFIDKHLNFRRLFAEAIRDSIVDNFDRSLIQPGYFLIRLGRQRPLVAARIYERPPDDGDTPAGEILGEPCDPVLVWTGRDREIADTSRMMAARGPSKATTDICALTRIMRGRGVGRSRSPIRGARSTSRNSHQSDRRGDNEKWTRSQTTPTLTGRRHLLPRCSEWPRRSAGSTTDRQNRLRRKQREPINAPEDKRVADLIEAATKWGEQYPKIEDEGIAAACTDCLNQLDKHWAAIEVKRRKAEREPHNKALKAIQDK